MNFSFFTIKTIIKEFYVDTVKEITLSLNLTDKTICFGFTIILSNVLRIPELSDKFKMSITGCKKNIASDTMVPLSDFLAVKEDFLRDPLILEAGNYLVKIQYEIERPRVMGRDLESNGSTIFLFKDTFNAKLHSVFENSEIYNLE